MNHQILPTHLPSWIATSTATRHGGTHRGNRLLRAPATQIQQQYAPFEKAHADSFSHKKLDFSKDLTIRRSSGPPRGIFRPGTIGTHFPRFVWGFSNVASWAMGAMFTGCWIRCWTLRVTLSDVLLRSTPRTVATWPFGSRLAKAVGTWDRLRWSPDSHNVGYLVRLKDVEGVFPCMEVPSYILFRVLSRDI